MMNSEQFDEFWSFCGISKNLKKTWLGENVFFLGKTWFSPRTLHFPRFPVPLVDVDIDIDIDIDVDIDIDIDVDIDID